MADDERGGESHGFSSKNRLSKFLLYLILILIGLHIIFNYTFKSKIDLILDTSIYLDHEVVGYTVITIEGVLSRTLLSWNKPSYIGTFYIEALPETGPGKYTETPRAQIRWLDDTTDQLIRYYRLNLPSTDFGLQDLMLDAEMSEVAVTLEDGRVLATSEEWYQLYRDRLDRLAEATTA